MLGSPNPVSSSSTPTGLDQAGRSAGCADFSEGRVYPSGLLGWGCPTMPLSADGVRA